MFSIKYKRNRRHHKRDKMTPRYKQRRKGTGRNRVSENDEKSMYEMWQQGYLTSEIGKRFGVVGETAGSHIRAYKKKLEESR